MVALPVKLSDEGHRLLQALSEQGLFGSTKEEAALLLLNEKLREIVRQGWLGVVGTPGRTEPIIR